MATILISPLIMGSTTKIYPSDDAYTDSSSPNSNFDNSNIRVGYDWNHGKHRGYFKFNLSSLENVSSAKLVLYRVASVGNPTIELHYVSSDSWNENSLTWNNAPLNESEIIDSKIVSSGNPIEFEITLLMNEQDNILSIALVADKEFTSNPEGYYTLFYSSNMGDEIYFPYIEVISETDCNTDADTNCNGCVEMGELLNFISEWKLGNAQMSELLNGISMWKSGGGC